MSQGTDVAVFEKLILDIGGNKIELTKEQAKALHEALGELFGAKERIVPQPYPVPSPAKPRKPDDYPEPYPWTPLPKYPRRWNEIWCCAGEGPRVTLSCK